MYVFEREKERERERERERSLNSCNWKAFTMAHSKRTERNKKTVKRERGKKWEKE